jgi:hypothetical protein
MLIPDPGSWIWIFSHPGSRIQIPDPGVKKHWIPDPQHCKKVKIKTLLKRRALEIYNLLLGTFEPRQVGKLKS